MAITYPKDKNTLCFLQAYYGDQQEREDDYYLSTSALPEGIYIFIIQLYRHIYMHYKFYR